MNDSESTYKCVHLEMSMEVRQQLSGKWWYGQGIFNLPDGRILTSTAVICPITELSIIGYYNLIHRTLNTYIYMDLGSNVVV